MKCKQAVCDNQMIIEYKSSTNYLQRAEARAGGMKLVNEIIMLLIGFALFGIGACGVFKWYVLNYPISYFSIEQLLYVWSVFYGIYIVSSANTPIKMLSSRRFYINSIGLAGAICFLALIIVLWVKLLLWRIENPAPFNLSNVFAAIPGNNLSSLSRESPEFIKKFFRIVYSTGFLLPFYIPIFASLIKLRYEKVWQYLLSGHLLQIFLVTPLYLLFQVQEIWYVNGIPDGLGRMFFSEVERNFMVSWCFPSMQTSIATASLLVALQEPYKIFKWSWCTYCVLVVIATLWLAVHWVVDVVLGILIGYVAVYLANRIIGSLMFQKYILGIDGTSEVEADRRYNVFDGVFDK
ncbi:MAG: hypothetical protein H6Q73_1333 [Firmicutes bacterium]|nr:hypothetical protein [Bacillota bacterium]